MIRGIALSLLCLALAAGPGPATVLLCGGSCCAVPEMHMTHGAPRADMGEMGRMGDMGHGCCCGDTPNPCGWEQAPFDEHDPRATVALLKVEPPEGSTLLPDVIQAVAPADLFSRPRGFTTGASPPGDPPVYLSIQSFLC